VSQKNLLPLRPYKKISYPKSFQAKISSLRRRKLNNPKLKTFFCFIFLSLNVFSHGGDDGPSTLEDEFAKNAHLHLPVTFSTLHGLSFGLENPLESHNESENEQGADEHSGFELNFHPVVYGGQDQFIRYISQDQSSAPTLQIESASEEKPFIRIENKKWDLGVGLNLEQHLPLSLLSMGVGASYVRGKNYYMIQKLNSRFEHRSPIRIPINSEEFSHWRPGDQLAFAAKSNLIFNAFIGIEPIIHLGPEISFSGIYRYRIELKDHKTILVQVTDINNTSRGIEASAFPFFLEIGQGRGRINALTYELNMLQKESYLTLKSIFNGRLDLAQKLALTHPEDVKIKISGTTSSSSISYGLVLPALFTLGKTNGRYLTNLDSQEKEEDHVHQEKISNAIIQSEKFTRGFFSNHMWENKTIASTIIQGEESAIGSVFTWSLSKDKMKPSFIRKKLQKISWILDRDIAQRLKLPTNNLGYLKIDLVLNFNGNNILNLLNSDKVEKIRSLALELLEQDFSRLGHRSFCRIKKYQHCLNSYSTHIFDKTRKITEFKNKINSYYLKNKSSKLPLEISNLIHELLQSKYLTQSFRKLNPTLSLNLSLEGEKIKRHLIKL